VRLEGLYQSKIPTSGNEPATFRLVTQCLNQMRHRVPQLHIHTYTHTHTQSPRISDLLKATLWYGTSHKTVKIHNWHNTISILCTEFKCYTKLLPTR